MNRPRTDPIEPEEFRRILSTPALAQEFFLPPDRATWDGERYTLGRASASPPTVAGVRLQLPDPQSRDRFAEQASREDLARLVRSLVKLRATPGLAGAVLSDEVLAGKDPTTPNCKRVVFGLACPADGRFESEPEAAAESHRRLKAAFAAAGLRVEQEQPFDPQTGMNGLSAWAGSVRLQRRPPFDRRWLLALLPLLLLGLLPLTCSDPGTTTFPEKASGEDPKFFGMVVATESFIILVDKSGSVEPYFQDIRAEAKRLIDAKMNRLGRGNAFANVIVYDGQAASALGRLAPLDDATAGRLDGYLDSLRAGGGTRLQPALEMAAAEVATHGRKTTLLILTDGADNTIAPMANAPDQIKQRLSGTPVVAHTITPRLFDPNADPTPVNPEELGLQAFSRAFDGRFGPSPER